jgi:predicted RNA-binding Zn ribbon-like protein
MLTKISRSKDAPAMSQHKIAFRFNSGRLSLDLVCTVRHRPSKHTELLTEPSDLGRWLSEANAIAQLAPVDAKRLADGKKLRKAIYESASSLHEGKTPDRKSIAVINDFAAQPLAKVQLDFRSWRPICVADDPVSAGLSVVARDAIDLFTGQQAQLIRTCDEPGCRMLFVDSSPGGRRRWCSMTRCGSRSKGETYRKRQDASRPGKQGDS